MNVPAEAAAQPRICLQETFDFLRISGENDDNVAFIGRGEQRADCLSPVAA
jgi:hypothetical protein